MIRTLKKIFLPVLCGVVILMSGCIPASWIEKIDRDEEEKYQKEQFEAGSPVSVGITLTSACMIITGSMEQYNTWNKLTGYFAPNIVAQVTQEVMDESVLQMVDYMRGQGGAAIKGQPTPVRDEAAPEGRLAHTGDFISVYYRKRIRFIYYRVARDENDNNNKGFWSLYIIDVKDIVDEEAYLNYAHQYAPGIHVGYPEGI